jgi:hypothetical protein
MKKHILLSIVSIASAILISSCASQYKLPAENEPAASIKVKMTVNVDKAKQQAAPDKISQAIAYSISLKDGKKTFQVADSEVAGMVNLRGNQNEIYTFRAHPGKPVTITTAMGLKYVTRRMENVEKTRRMSRNVYKTVYEYDYSSKTSKPVSRYVTEYYDEKYTVQEHVVRTHFVGCPASYTFIPEKDQIYLLDYSNLLVTSGCSAQAYTQETLKGGKFKLNPVAEYTVPEK